MSSPAPAKRRGRPRGNRSQRAYGVRPTLDAIARAEAADQTISERIDLALELLGALDDSIGAPGHPAGALRAAIAAYRIKGSQRAD